MKLHVLGSGSKGNCAIVETADAAIMVDCGLSGKAVRERMRQVGFDPSKLRALLVTHEHIDHVKGIGVNLRSLGVEGEMPVYCTVGTRENDSYLARYGNFVRIAAGSGFDVCGIHVDVFDISHDVAEPVGFKFSYADGGVHGGRGGHGGDADGDGGCGEGVSSIGYMTDSGVCTPMARETLAGCELLAIETNHDPRMLRMGPYPAYLKKRIASDRGHLSNDQAKDLLDELASDDLRFVVGMHISQENNDRDIPLHMLSERLGQMGLSATGVEIAGQNIPRSICP